jgi:hypothetical protein
MRSSLALAIAGLGAVACATYGQEVTRIRQGLIGLPALDLRTCLPDPSEIRPDGDTETAIYRWEFKPREDRSHYSKFEEPRDESDPDLTRERRRFLEAGERPRHLAYCQLSFRLRGGRVEAVEVEGRDRNGLNAQSDCIMQTHSCIPEPKAPAGS